MFQRFCKHFMSVFIPLRSKRTPTCSASIKRYDIPTQDCTPCYASFPFFKLPPELRNRIYELAYARRTFEVTDKEIMCKGFRLPYMVRDDSGKSTKSEANKSPRNQRLSCQAHYVSLLPSADSTLAKLCRSAYTLRPSRWTA